MSVVLKERSIGSYLCIFFNFLFLSASFLLSSLKIKCGPSITKSGKEEALSAVCMLTPYPAVHAPQVKAPFCLLDRKQPVYLAPLSCLSLKSNDQTHK